MRWTTRPTWRPPTRWVRSVVGDAVGVDEPVGFDGWPVDWVTEVEAGVDGEVVPLVGVVTVAVGVGAGATVVVVAATAWADWRTASDGFEPPLPPGATVVVGADATVVAVVPVAGAAVVGGVVVASAVAGAALAVVPWVPVWVPAGAVAGAVSAEAGRALSRRNSPPRSAKAATHLRGRTSSFRGLLVIG